MTTDYVSDSFMIRWTTLWIYSFHMPAFIFISGLVHKYYITEEKASLGAKGETRLRWDKVLGFFLCGYGLKLFLQFTRTLMGQHPLWHTIEEPGIPWYLFVMAEYEMLFYVMRRLDEKVKPWMMISGAFILSAAVGYFPFINDTFCLSRMINFLPIYMIGYYLDMKEFNSFLDEKKRLRAAGWCGIAASMAVCYFGPWGLYSWRKWFTGRRSYAFLNDFFPGTYSNGWWIRLAVWLVAIVITLCVVSVVPDRKLGYVTTVGARTLNIYFWHRPVCYLFRNWAVLPKLFVLFGGRYNASVAGQIKGEAFVGGDMTMLAAYAVYILIAAAMTVFFSLKVFEHPCSDLMKLAGRITSGKKE
ncbi:MAG: hypothetical protein IJH92_09620 [Mogibacterium sp.]|nr:hypothetical protein [Mogibacterium sp.]